jgi:hypothetical protein
VRSIRMPPGFTPSTRNCSVNSLQGMVRRVARTSNKKGEDVSAGSIPIENKKESGRQIESSPPSPDRRRNAGARSCGSTRPPEMRPASVILPAQRRVPKPSPLLALKNRSLPLGSLESLPPLRRSTSEMRRRMQSNRRMPAPCDEVHSGAGKR